MHKARDGSAPGLDIAQFLHGQCAVMLEITALNGAPSELRLKRWG